MPPLLRWWEDLHILVQIGDRRAGGDPAAVGRPRAAAEPAPRPRPGLRRVLGRPGHRRRSSAPAAPRRRAGDADRVPDGGRAAAPGPGSPCSAAGGGRLERPIVVRDLRDQRLDRARCRRPPPRRGSARRTSLTLGPALRERSARWDVVPGTDRVASSFAIWVSNSSRAARACGALQVGLRVVRLLTGRSASAVGLRPPCRCRRGREVVRRPWAAAAVVAAVGSRATGAVAVVAVVSVAPGSRWCRTPSGPAPSPSRRPGRPSVPAWAPSSRMTVAGSSPALDPAAAPR